MILAITLIAPIPDPSAAIKPIRGLTASLNLTFAHPRPVLAFLLPSTLFLRHPCFIVFPTGRRRIRIRCHQRILTGSASTRSRQTPHLLSNILKTQSRCAPAYTTDLPRRGSAAFCTHRGDTHAWGRPPPGFILDSAYRRDESNSARKASIVWPVRLN